MSTSLPGPQDLLWDARPPRLAPGPLASAHEPCVDRCRKQASHRTRGVAWTPVCGLDPGAAGGRGGPHVAAVPSLAQSPRNMVGAASRGFWRSS